MGNSFDTRHFYIHNCRKAFTKQLSIWNFSCQKVDIHLEEVDIKSKKWIFAREKWTLKQVSSSCTHPFS